eukprot:10113731-Lingulodinium_polyedra.AAC.1
MSGSAATTAGGPFCASRRAPPGPATGSSAWASPPTRCAAAAAWGPLTRTSTASGSVPAQRGSLPRSGRATSRPGQRLGSTRTRASGSAASSRAIGRASTRPRT